jgi:hypothetical protein
MYYAPELNRVLRSRFEIVAAFPNVSFPDSLRTEDLEGLGIYVVEPMEAQHDPITHAARELPPALIDGQYVQQWEIYQLDTEAVAANRETATAALRTSLPTDNNAAYETAISQMTADYPASEIATWERQRAEVIAWEADSTAATPWIDIAASARGLDRDIYLTRTLEKVHAFAQASAWLTGRRQGIDDAIRAATTLEELRAIMIDYTLPGANV